MFGMRVSDVLLVLILVLAVVGSKRPAGTGGDLGVALRAFRHACCEADAAPQPRSTVLAT